jgi:assimilatory nitrate reductase electron transfer subunit
MTARRVVVVGFGMAGGRFVDDLLARPGSDAAAVTVVGGEPYAAYNRVLLGDVVAGRADVAGLGLGDLARYATRGVDVRLATQAVAIDRVRGRVGLDDGTAVPFDRLVLATGAAPVVPELAGLEVAAPPAGVHVLRPAGVHVLRTVDDAREIVAACANARRALVLGGGLLGLEAARGLARRGLDVEVLHARGHLLPGVLDAAGAAVLTRTLRRLGVAVRTRTVARAVTSRGGRLTGMVLADGTCLPADLLVLACGVRPRTGLARRAGLAVRRGVVVDDALATSDPRILAIGDCSEHGSEVAGLVAPAWEQARVAADLISGTRPDARYAGHRPAVRLKAADVEVAAMGDTAPDPWADEPGLEVVQLLDAARGRYVKAVVRDGVVVGAAVVGDARAAAELRLLVERASPAPAQRATLLLPGLRREAGTGAGADDPTAIPDRATICRCNGVTKGALVRAWTTGARSGPDLARATRATTGCGTCADAVTGLAAWLAASDADAPDADAPDADAPDADAPDASDPAVPGRSPVPAPTGGTR